MYQNINAEQKLKQHKLWKEKKIVGVVGKNPYAIKYLCAKVSSFAGSTVAICPSIFTSYVS